MSFKRRLLRAMEAADPAPIVQRQEIRVMISSPMQDLCHTHFCVSLVNLFAHCAVNATDGLTVGFHQYGTSILHFSRHALVKKALELDATHMLWLDSDMEFPPDTLLRLLRHGKPFVAANCIARREPFALTARHEDGSWIYTNRDSSGLEKCAKVGLAVALTSMDMFRAIQKPWFEMPWLAESDYELPLGEDFYFCKKAREAGFEIYVDHDLSQQVNHVGTFQYNPMMREQMAAPTR